MQLNGKRAFVLTLGCRLNQADTALILSRLTEIGFEIVKTSENIIPDLVVINTCTVTSNASSKSRKGARQYRKLYPNTCIVVTGCDCNNAKKQWDAEDWVDIVLLNKDKIHLAEKVREWFSIKNSSNISCSENREFITEKKSVDLIFKEEAIAIYPFKKRAFLKIQEGCNSFCTYCIVPHVRGPERSRDSNEILKEAEALIRAGHKEIIITGVNISSYQDKSHNIISLIKKISEINGNFRLRLSSMEPHEKNFELVDLIKDNSKICRFLHVALQSGANHILKVMNRNYSSENFERFVNYAKTQISGIHLGTDVIVGFPGETDELFFQTAGFLEKIQFSNIHVFRFSPRDGTPAAKFKNQINNKIVKSRAEVLQQIAKKSKSAFSRSQLGQKLNFLIESIKSNQYALGVSDNYIKVKINNLNFIPGEIYSAILKNDMFLSK